MPDFQERQFLIQSVGRYLMNNCTVLVLHKLQCVLMLRLYLLSLGYRVYWESVRCGKSGKTAQFWLSYMDYASNPPWWLSKPCRHLVVVVRDTGSTSSSRLWSGDFGWIRWTCSHLRRQCSIRNRNSVVYACDNCRLWSLHMSCPRSWEIIKNFCVNRLGKIRCNKFQLQENIQCEYDGGCGWPLQIPLCNGWSPRF